VWLWCALVLVAVFSSSGRAGDVMSPRLSHLNGLLPAFRARCERIEAGMARRGFRVVRLETVRSEARAAELATRGTGIVRSTHVARAAVDYGNYDGRNALGQLDPYVATDAFWEALGEETRAAGCFWGGDFRPTVKRPKGDRPHVQALPPKFDARLWALRNNPEQANAFVRAQYELSNA